ncbi:hypothetical protein L9F63_019767 [Diploptera punctata]|uniref:Uncharacterized protein n=1 Tax=Diploptera punctata TaxID=6984 RepID=A0AAD8EEB4_DIPPU|nr:hypothetical protein L9F63_019767 [Diploptera punctata]
MKIEFVISFSLFSIVCFQPQEVVGVPLDFGLVDSIRNNVRDHLVRPIQQVLNPQNKQTTTSITPESVTTPLPSSAIDGVNIQETTVTVTHVSTTTSLPSSAVDDGSVQNSQDITVGATPTTTSHPTSAVDDVPSGVDSTPETELEAVTLSEDIVTGTTEDVHTTDVIQKD